MFLPLIVGWRGDRVDRADPLIQAVAAGRVAGVILFATDVPTGQRRNIRSPEQLRRLTSDLQAMAPQPLLIAIDQEGGTVQRLRAEAGFIETPAAADLGQGPIAPAEAAFDRQAAQLAELGINLNFAPVVDLAVDPDNPVIAGRGRSFGRDPAAVTALARLALAAHRRHGVAACLKHFPGHGSSSTDSHLGLTDVTATWLPEELDPYRALAAEAPAVLVAHVMHRGMDPDRPASLSPAITQACLRTTLGFTGAVISDDMQMGAITDAWPFPESAILALQAGCDLLIYGNNLIWQPTIVDDVARAVEQALQDGRLSESHIKAAAVRTAALIPSA
ncbi:MAG: glycoside hydrolase family 3 [Candidatus Sericytochromatia bacterium]|nr:glycoside hydrolase family 3 [Candidatus Sericytochromatia bacterium]